MAKARRYNRGEVAAIGMAERAGKFLLRDTYQDPKSPRPKYRLWQGAPILRERLYWWDMTFVSSEKYELGDELHQRVKLNGHMKYERPLSALDVYVCEVEYVLRCPSGDGKRWRPDEFKISFTQGDWKRAEVFSADQLLAFTSDENYLRYLLDYRAVSEAEEAKAS